MKYLKIAVPVLVFVMLAAAATLLAYDPIQLRHSDLAGLSSNDHPQYALAAAVPTTTEVALKTDRVVGAGLNHFASLDVLGNLLDSGYSGSSFLTGAQVNAMITATPEANKIPIASAAGKLAGGWVDRVGNMGFAFVRHTITAGEAGSGTFTATWSTATPSKIISIHTVKYTLSAMRVDADQDWYSANAEMAVGFVGTTITVGVLGSWFEGDVITVFIVYEK